MSVELDTVSNGGWSIGLNPKELLLRHGVGGSQNNSIRNLPDGQSITAARHKRNSPTEHGETGLVDMVTTPLTEVA